MKTCTKCDKENPSSAKHCMHCGGVLEEIIIVSEVDKLQNELEEVKKTNELLKKALENQPAKKNDFSKDEANNIDKKEVILTPTPSLIEKVSYSVVESKSKNPTSNHVKPLPPKKSNKTLIILGVVAFGFFGMFYFFNVFLPAKKDKDAARYYTIADKSNIRSSQDKGAKYNIVTTVDYGSELITYEYIANDWSEVKDANKNKGFVSSHLIVTKSDFTILNDLFGDNESRDNISTIKCRVALLNYYKKNSLGSNWKVFTRNKKLKPNNVYYERILDKNSKFTDFAVILKNTDNYERKIVVFGFNEDESVAWVNDGVAPPTGYIKYIRRNYSGNFDISYSD